MREYAVKHKLNVPAVMWTSNVWGTGARTLAWRVSGHYGKATTDKAALWSKFNPPTLGELALAFGETKLGVHEVGDSNSGRWVDLFLKAVYLPGGFAWCAAFVSWCTVEALMKLGMVGSYEAGRDLLHDLMYGNAAFVPNWLRAAREGHTVRGWKVVLVAPEHAQAGDILIFWGGQHIGRLRKAGWLGIWRRTVEGNTSDNDAGDQANGGEVVNKLRSKGDITAYLRIVKTK